MRGFALALLIAFPPGVLAGDALLDPVDGARGDAARGRAIVVNRQLGLCLLCHSGPFPEERFQGNLGPDLSGVGARLSEGQIRLRLVDPGILNKETIMPSYFRTDGFARVGASFRGKAVLSAQQVEDVVVYLATLR